MWDNTTEVTTQHSYKGLAGVMTNVFEGVARTQDDAVRTNEVVFRAKVAKSYLRPAPEGWNPQLN